MAYSCCIFCWRTDFLSFCYLLLSFLWHCFIPPCPPASLQQLKPIGPALFHLSAASPPIPLLSCTSRWLTLPFPGQAPFWFSPPLSAWFPLHHFQCRMLLPLTSASFSPRFSSFFGPPFTKRGSQLVFPHWRKSTRCSSWVWFPNSHC